MKVELAGDEVFAGAFQLARRRAFSGFKHPVVIVGLGEFAAGGEAGEVLEEETAFAAAGEREFADELLVAGALAGRALDATEQVAVAV